MLRNFKKMRHHQLRAQLSRCIQGQYILTSPEKQWSIERFWFWNRRIDQSWRTLRIYEWAFPYEHPLRTTSSRLFIWCSWVTPEGDLKGNMISIVLNWLNKPRILCRRFTQSRCSPWWPNVRKHDLERGTWSVDVHWLWAGNAASPMNTTWGHFHLIKNTEVNLWEKSPCKHFSCFEREKPRMRHRLWWSHSSYYQISFHTWRFLLSIQSLNGTSGNSASKSRYMEREGRKLGSSRYCPLFKSDSMQSEEWLRRDMLTSSIICPSASGTPRWQDNKLQVSQPTLLGVISYPIQ